jgi:hypothetical protein
MEDRHEECSFYSKSDTNVTTSDLVTLRTSDINLSELVAPLHKLDRAVEVSFEFVRNAKEIVRIAKEGTVENQGLRIDAARENLDEISTTLSEIRKVRVASLLVASLLTLVYSALDALE